jgi:hypothetical protein
MRNTRRERIELGTKITLENKRVTSSRMNTRKEEGDQH